MDQKEIEENVGEVKKNTFQECCLYEKTVCGSFTNRRTLYEELVNVHCLTESVEGYLRDGLHYKESVALMSWTEKKLIENRLGRYFVEGEKLCPYHRFMLGTIYHPSTQCSLVAHEPVKRGKKSAKTIRLPLSQINKLNRNNPFSYKVRARVCNEHKKMIYQQLPSVDDSLSALEVEPDDLFDASVMDEDYTPHVYIVDDVSTLDEYTSIAKEFGVTPIKHKISKPINDLSAEVQTN